MHERIGRIIWQITLKVLKSGSNSLTYFFKMALCKEELLLCSRGVDASQLSDMVVCFKCQIPVKFCEFTQANTPVQVASTCHSKEFALAVASYLRDESLTVELAHFYPGVAFINRVVVFLNGLATVCLIKLLNLGRINWQLGEWMRFFAYLR